MLCCGMLLVNSISIPQDTFTGTGVIMPQYQKITLMYTTGQKFGIFGKHHVNSRIWHFNLLQMAGHQPQIDVVTLM